MIYTMVYGSSIREGVLSGIWEYKSVYIVYSKHSHFQGGEGMRYVKVILTIIAVLLAMLTFKGLIVPESNASNVMDVNIAKIGGLSIIGSRLDVHDETTFNAILKLIAKP